MNSARPAFSRNFVIWVSLYAKTTQNPSWYNHVYRTIWPKTKCSLQYLTKIGRHNLDKSIYIFPCFRTVFHVLHQRSAMYQRTMRTIGYSKVFSHWLWGCLRLKRWLKVKPPSPLSHLPPQKDYDRCYCRSVFKRAVRTRIDVPKWPVHFDRWDQITVATPNNGDPLPTVDVPDID